MYKVNCPRCTDGTGLITGFKHVKGGECFRCHGAGFITVKTDPAILAARRKKRQEKTALKAATRMAEAQQRAANLELKYRDDPRIGRQCRENCKNPVYAYEVYKTLNDIDTGVYKYGLETLPNITE